MILSDNETSKCLLEITSHDYYTYTHSVNVGVLSVLLAKTFYLYSDAHDMYELGAGFFLHDIGKTRVDSSIINKQGKLTEEEMRVMRTHPQHGYDILKEANQLSKECRIIVMQHHEREDGSGYPLGLKGDEIHDYSRICSIADIYDALTSRRSYHKPMRPFEALKFMRDKLMQHFKKEIFINFVLLFR
ncbi:MAG: HD-GYP domain-containing protein [Nitrospirae bacterium]|nr:MAG: HD-GYP domain-containing protein [Nitrospirota bacterium]